MTTKTDGPADDQQVAHGHRRRREEQGKAIPNFGHRACLFFFFKKFLIIRRPRVLAFYGIRMTSSSRVKK